MFPTEYLIAGLILDPNRVKEKLWREVE
jgi:hypothetical protein